MSGEVNFLSLRSELEHWTLQSDQKLFTAIKAMSDKIIATESELQISFKKTKSSIVQNKVDVTNNFNQFLRLSQFKFTENKIAQNDKTTKEDSSKKQQKKQKQTKSKMDIYKQAIKLSISNLDIKQQDKQADNISVSEISLSQAIFKSTKTPALYGTAQYRKTKFLNLFSDEELVQSRRTFLRKEQHPQSIPTSPNTEVRMSKSEITIRQQQPLSTSGLLPPPPPLSSVLNNNFSQILPPPPSISNLPPIPPMTLTLPSVPNLTLPPPPPLTLIPPPLAPALNLLPPPLNASNQVIKQTIVESSQPKTKRSLTMQQELALRLKQGKDYKKPSAQAPQFETRKDVKLDSIRQSIQQEDKISNAPFRASQNVDQILKHSGNPFQKKQENIFDAQQQQDQTSIFGPSRTRIKDKLMSKPTPIGIKMDSTIKQSTPTVKQQQNIMRRQTFNEDVIIKKVDPEKVAFKQDKQKPKKNGLFGSDDEQEDPFSSLKRRNTSKVEINKPLIVKQKQKNNKLFEDDQQDDLLTSKKGRTQTNNINFQKKPSPLIATSSKIPEAVAQRDQEDQQKNQKKIEKQSKENPLESTISKQKPISLPTIPKMEKVKPTKKSLFDDDQDDSSFISKVSTAKGAKKEEKIQKVNNEVIKQVVKEVVKEQKDKIKNNLITDNIVHNNNIEDLHLKDKQSQQPISSVKRMVALGGQSMLPMMLPGMNITKPSQAKKQQQQAMKRMHQRKKQEQQREKQQQLQRDKQQQNNIRQLQYAKQSQSNSQEQRENQVKEVKQDYRMSNGAQSLNKVNFENEAENKTQKPIINQQNLLPATRKKKKPTKNKIDFDQQENRDNIPTAVQVPKRQKNVQQIEQGLNPTENIRPVSNNISQTSSFSNKFSAGIGVSILPVLPNNLSITKPSQAKKLQKQAQQRQQKERKIQQQKEKKIQQQKQYIQKQQQLQNARKRQEQRQFMERQKIKRQNEQKLEIQKRQKEEMQRIEQQRHRIWEQQQRMERKRYQQAMLVQKTKLEEQKKAFQLEKKRIQEQKQMQRRREMQELEQRQRVAAQEERKRKAQLPQIQKMPQESRVKAGPLGFVPKLPTRNPLGGETTKPSTNPLPVIPKPAISSQKANKKGGLFDGSDEQEPKFKKPETLNKNIVQQKKEKKGGLFDDGQQESQFKLKSIKPVGAKKNKGLFDDEEDDGDFFKPKSKVENTSGPNTKEVNQPVKLPSGLPSFTDNKVQSKPVTKKKNLFSDEENEETVVKQVKVLQKQPSFVPENIPPQQITFTNRNLFEDSDDSQDAEALKKKRLAAKKLRGAF